MFAGYRGKAVDGIISQLINLVLIVPRILILAVFAKKYGADPTGIAIVIALVSPWTRIARVIRGLVMQLKEQEFVQAARAAGAGPTRGSRSANIMPNVMGPVLVEPDVDRRDRDRTGEHALFPRSRGETASADAWQPAHGGQRQARHRADQGAHTRLCHRVDHALRQLPR